MVSHGRILGSVLSHLGCPQPHHTIGFHDFASYSCYLHAAWWGRCDPRLETHPDGNFYHFVPASGQYGWKTGTKNEYLFFYWESSSSLGMLLDHGADAVASFLIALQFCKIFQLSYELSLFTIYIFIMKTEFCAMWSQYCVGYFRLGVINPVDEGLPFYSITCLVVTQLDLSKFGE